MANIIHLYSEYQRNKWFPQTYPDPFGELIDYINEDAIRGIVAESKKSGNRGLLQIAMELSHLLPMIRFRDSYKDFAAVYQKKLAPAGCRPQFSYFHLRNLELQERIQLWENLQEWADRSRNQMLNWHHNRIELAKSFEELQTEYESAYGMNREASLKRIEKWLTSTKEEFDFDFERYAEVKKLPETLALFRLRNWDHIFDWNDFPELAGSFFKVTQMKNTPLLRRSQMDDAVQACLTVYPPRKVFVEYGNAAGPFDAGRFVAETALGCFYTNMNSEVSDEFRFSGDPRISEFWRALFLLAFVSKSGLQNIVGELAVDLSSQLMRFVTFWLRYDAFLAVYKNAAEQDLNAAEDTYAEYWRKAFPLELSSQLYLFELDRSTSAIWRVEAMEAAVYVHEQLRTHYGNAWFSSTPCMTRLKDYWWEGFNLSFTGLLQDLNIKLSEDLYFFSDKEHS